MRRGMLVALLLVGSSAVAGPMVNGNWERGAGKTGLVVYDLYKEGTCDNLDPWTPEVAKNLVDNNTLAVRIDYMKDGESVKKLVGAGFLTVPMRIAYLDGVEVDRACGCMDGAALVTWMDDLRAGKTRADVSRSKLSGDLGKDLTPSLDIVQQEYCANRPEKGFDTLELLWNGLDRSDDAIQAVRFSRVAHDMAVLARKSPVVTERIAALRDSLDAAKDVEDAKLDDWVALNRILLQDDVTLSWFDAHRSDPAFATVIAHQAPNLLALLVERTRWADAGGLIGDAEAWLDWARPTTGGLDLSIDSYVALFAAGRTKDADTFAKGVLKVAPEGTACKILTRATGAGFSSSAQSKIAKLCKDEAVVTAWKAAQ